MAIELLKDVVFTLGSSPTMILGCREAKLNTQVEDHNVTTYDDLATSRATKHKPGLVTYTINCSGVVSSATSGNDTKALLDGTKAGTTWGAKFATGASDSYTCSGHFTSFEVTGGADYGPATWSATFQVDGDLTVAT